MSRYRVIKGHRILKNSEMVSGEKQRAWEGMAGDEAGKEVR